MVPIVHRTHALDVARCRAGADICPCRGSTRARVGSRSSLRWLTHRPITLIGVLEVITALAIGIVLVSFIVIGIAVADTARFARRTGNQVPVALAYRPDLAKIPAGRAHTTAQG